MAGSRNLVVILGNVGKDPEVRKMSNGDPVATFSVATSERWKDKSTGEVKELTEWHRIVVFNPTLVDVVERMLQKGTRVYIEGQLRTRKWQNQAGRDQYTTEIVLSGFNGTLVVAANAKQSSNTPPPIDCNPEDHAKGIEDAFAEASAIMDDGYEVPF